MWFDAKAADAFCRTAWLMMSDEQREAELQRMRDEGNRLIDAINAQFAVVIDGPRAGQCVSVSNGRRTSQGTINAFFLKQAGWPVANIRSLARAGERSATANFARLRKQRRPARYADLLCVSSEYPS
jgi:hypothetical protein